MQDWQNGSCMAFYRHLQSRKAQANFYRGWKKRDVNERWFRDSVRSCIPASMQTRADRQLQRATDQFRLTTYCSLLFSAIFVWSCAQKPPDLGINLKSQWKADSARLESNKEKIGSEQIVCFLDHILLEYDDYVSNYFYINFYISINELVSTAYKLGVAGLFTGTHFKNQTRTFAT